MCTRLGVLLHEGENGPIEAYVDPDPFAEAMITAAAAAVSGRLDAGPAGWQAALQVLIAVARIVPHPLSGIATDAIAELRRLPDGLDLVLPEGPASSGPVLWTRDAYGSRFGITATFPEPWLRGRQPSEPLSADTEEIARELADSWDVSGPGALYLTCSAHRVASVVLHVRNYYEDDFAAQVVAILPDWISWLTERTGMAPQLAERCRPYALGQPYPGVGSDNSRPSYLARVAE